MKPAENIEKLLRECEEAISPQFDEETLRDVLSAMSDSISERSGFFGSVLGRLRMQSNLMRIAAAVVLATGLAFWAHHLVGEKLPPQGPRSSQTPEAPRAVEPGESMELERAHRLFVANDIPRLIKLLQTGVARTKIKVAEYLEQVGDASALPALQTLADQWPDATEGNPFDRAVQAIQARDASKSGQVDPSRPDETEPTVAPIYPFQARGVLSGLITDAQTGEPVVGARVEAFVRRVFRVKTDEHGFYAFDEVEGDGNYQIRITSQTHLSPGPWDRRPTVAVKADGQAVKHFRLERGCRVKVNVVDEQGRPVAGAWVSASWLGAERGKMDLGEARTDPNGTAVVGAVESSDIEYRLIARHDDYAPSHATLRLNRPSRLEQAHVVLPSGIEVQGYAEYADGVPAEGVQIYAQPDWWHSNHLMGHEPVDGNGLFTLKHIVPGVSSIHVYFQDKNLGGGTSFSLTQAELPVPAGELLSLRIPKKSPQSLVSIIGSIVWASEKRPNRLEVTASSAIPSVHERVSLRGDLDSFEIGALEPGLYTLQFRGADLKNKILRNIQAPNHDLEVVLEYQDKPHLTGTVVAADTNQLIERFRARMIQVKYLHDSYYTPPANWHQVTNGQFDLETRGPGVYRLQIIAEGFAPTLSEEINTDENGPMTIRLGKGGRLQGRVINADGEPVSGAKIIPLSTAKGNTPTLLNLFLTEEGATQTVNGSFLFQHLSPGVDSFKVVHPDYAQVLIEEIEIREGETVEEMEIVMDRGASIEGYVYDLRGRPEANVTLFVQDETGSNVPPASEATRLNTAVTDANGFYRADRLPAGRLCHLVRKDGHQTMGVVHRACVPSQERTVRMDFGGGPILSATLHEDGVPLLNTRIRLGGQHTSHSKVFRCSGITDGFGRFDLPGVPPGRYGIHYEAPGQRGQWVLIAYAEVGQEDVKLGVIPKEAASLNVTLRTQDPTADLSGWRIHVQENMEIWGSRPGAITTPTSSDQPTVIKGLMPGTHQVVASQGGVYIRQAVQMASNRDLVDMTFDLPAATASISGLLNTPPNQSLILWNEDSTVSAFLTREGETYRIDHLPAGSYVIGDRLLKAHAPIAAFSLAEGEAKTLAIDLTDWSPDVGVLFVSVADRQGRLLRHTEAWLKGPGGPHGPSPAPGDDGLTFVAPPGEYVLAVMCEDYQPYTETMSLTATALKGSSFRKEYKTVVLNPE